VYMLGFGGIEILWRQLEFVPRDLGLLLGPFIYFYLRSQFDASFRFRLRDAWHAVPFLIHAAYHMAVFAQGPDFVQDWQKTVHWPLHIGDVEYAFMVGQQFLYLYWSVQLYRGYRIWIKNQFSETDSISFRWYRNFLLALAVTMVFSLFMALLDIYLNLSFWQDWWGNLVCTLLIYYVSIEGYAQAQPARKLSYNPADSGHNVPSQPVVAGAVVDTATVQGSLAVVNSVGTYLKPPPHLVTYPTRCPTCPTALPNCSPT
jgi:hypothetical protein